MLSPIRMESIFHHVPTATPSSSVVILPEVVLTSPNTTVTVPTQTTVLEQYLPHDGSYFSGTIYKTQRIYGHNQFSNGNVFCGHWIQDKPWNGWYQDIHPNFPGIKQVILQYKSGIPASTSFGKIVYDDGRVYDGDIKYHPATKEWVRHSLRGRMTERDGKPGNPQKWKMNVLDPNSNSN